MSMERLFQQPVNTPLADWVKAHSPIYAVEPKWDGERAFLIKQRDTLRVVNRRGYDYQNILKWQLPAIPDSVILDGELVAPENKVYALIRQLKKPSQIFFIAFDNVKDDKPFKQRRQDLEALAPHLPDFVHIVEHKEAVNEQGIRGLYNYYTSQGFEGIVVKADLPYLTKGSWLKLKKTETHDLIVTGLSKRKASILLGAYVKGVLEDVCSCSMLLPKDCFLTLMQPLKIGEDANYIRYKPEVVLEVRAQEITHTEDGISLRNPVPLRFRDDKKPEDCTFAEPTLSTQT